MDTQSPRPRRADARRGQGLMQRWSSPLCTTVLEETQIYPAALPVGACLQATAACVLHKVCRVASKLAPTNSRLREGEDASNRKRSTCGGAEAQAMWRNRARGAQAATPGKEGFAPPSSGRRAGARVQAAWRGCRALRSGRAAIPARAGRWRGRGPGHVDVAEWCLLNAWPKPRVREPPGGAGRSPWGARPRVLLEVTGAGVEPATLGFMVRCSTRLSYPWSRRTGLEPATFGPQGPTLSPLS